MSPSMKTSFASELEARGIIKQITDPGLPALLDRQPLTLYAGFDPTADTLHVGSLLPLLTLKRFQMAGHTPIAVVGGATGMIGDPSGKTAERTLLSNDILSKNVEGIRKTIGRFLDTQGPNAVRVVNNNDWFKGMGYTTFLRDVGKHFTVNHMMAKESVRARLEDREHGISYTEFSYMLLQAYDFYVLHEKNRCTLQIGGSDQWGNITAGCELIRRMAAAHQKPAPDVYGLTHPLVMKSDGTKFGKTEQGSVWVDAERTSPYQFYQFFFQTADDDVSTFLRYFSFKSLEEIQALETSLKKEPEKRLAQKALAAEITELVHGKAALEKVEGASQALFSTSLKDLDESTLLETFKDAPSTTFPLSRVAGSGSLLVDLIAESGLCNSKGAARKEIQGGGIYLNNERVSDVAAALKKELLISGKFAVLRRGKKTYHLLRFS